MEQYVANGLVRVGYIHFAFLGDESIQAAEASECAHEQDAFWPYHDLLFERLSSGDREGFNDESLVEMAETLNLNADQFSNCLASDKYNQLVQQETSFSQSLGVRSTPSFILNGQPVVGAQPFENFQQLIEAELGR